jgi:hypothetical protein
VYHHGRGSVKVETVGVMEYWNVAALGSKPIYPLLQYSITPFARRLLKKPLAGCSKRSRGEAREDR